MFLGCGGRIRTFGGRINSAVPYQLGYATKNEKGEKGNRGMGKWENSIVVARVALPVPPFTFSPFPPCVGGEPDLSIDYSTHTNAGLGSMNIESMHEDLSLRIQDVLSIVCKSRARF